jgi:hypothetical protein
MTKRKAAERQPMWVRADDVVTRAVGDELFVALPAEGSIHTLNAMGAAVWHALEEPRTFADLLALFEAAFPDTDPRRIGDDLNALLETLARDGLVRREP